MHFGTKTLCTVGECCRIGLAKAEKENSTFKIKYDFFMKRVISCSSLKQQDSPRCFF